MYIPLLNKRIKFKFNFKTKFNFKVKFNFNVIIMFIITIVMFLLALFRIRAGNSIGIDCLQIDLALYDSYFFAKSAMFFENFNYSEPLALIKNRSFVWILMLFHYLGIFPQTGVSLLWVIAALLIFIVTYRTSNNRILAFIMYTFTLFHPLAFFCLGNVSTYRNIVFIQIAIIYISLLLVLFYRVLKNKNYIINILLSVILGLVFVAQYFLVETGIIHLLILVSLILLFAIYILLRHKYLIKKSVVIFIPVLIFVISFNLYKFINFRVFGVSEINMRTEAEIGGFINRVQSIESDMQDKLIWCSIDQLDKTYKVSQTLKDNKSLYNSIREGGGASAYVKGKGYAGDFLSWGIVNSLNQFGIDYNHANKIFKSINDEIDLAFKTGSLKKSNKILLSKTLGRYSLPDIQEIANQSIDIIIHFIKFISFDKFISVFKPSEDYQNKYFEFFNLKNEDTYISYFEFVIELINCYSFINTIFVIITLLLILIVLIINISDFKRYVLNLTDNLNIFTDINKLGFLIICFIMFFALYIFAISSFLIWTKYYSGFAGYQEILYYNYASTAFAFMIFVFVFANSLLLKIIVKIIKKYNINKYLFDIFSKLIKNIVLFCTKFKNPKYAFYTICLIVCLFIASLLFYLHKEVNNNVKILKIANEKYIEELNRDNYKKEKIKYINDLFKNNKRHRFDKKYVKNIFKKKSELISFITVMGDSYAERLSFYIKNNLSFENNTFYKPQKTILDNYNLYIEAIHSDIPIILYSCSVNDHFKQTDLETFKQRHEELFNESNINNKIIVLHSYMDYDLLDVMRDKVDNDTQNNKNYKIEDYDLVLKKLSNYYDNVIYIDCKDMQTKKYKHDDNIHYNFNFHSAFLSRSIDALQKYLNLK